MSHSVIIIGSGFAGLSSACFMAKAGWNVTVIEKNAGPGGRAGQLVSQDFKFDKGPSWYWMPEVFERFFASFGRSVNDYYHLQRLDPSYRVYWDEGFSDIPAGLNELKELFESIEPGSSIALEKYLLDAFYKYKLGMSEMVYKPGRSISELINGEVIQGMLASNVFGSIKKHIANHFKDPKLRQLMEFPVLFLGALPKDTPALYSLMNYADFKGGTWYPKGGMYSVVDAMYQLALELGVSFHFNEAVISMEINNRTISSVSSSENEYKANAVISSADYHFTEENLLEPEHRSYSSEYWKKRTLAPSCLLYYTGVSKKLKDVAHHSLFFDTSFELHGKEIYKDPTWPSEPLFYVSANSVSDDTVAPAGSENLVFLIPIAAGLTGDDKAMRDIYFKHIVKRFEKRTGTTISDSIVYAKTVSVSDFASDYNSYKGNAYGLANTLTQTSLLKPKCKSKKVNNLFYTGQFTVPGPGVPPCIISGEVVAKELLKEYSSKKILSAV